MKKKTKKEIMTVKMEEISPEKLAKIDQEMMDLRIHDLTLSSLHKLSKDRKEAVDKLSNLELQCKVRAMKAHSIGFSKRELAEIFNVTTNTITKWVG